MLLLPFFPVLSQDSIPSSSSNRIEFIYGLDNRRTHIQGQNTLIYGAYTGIGFNSRLRLKIGFSGTPFEVGKTEVSEGVTQRNRFYFLTFGEEFDFLEFNRFTLTTYLQAGYGYNNYRQISSNSSSTLTSGRQVIIPLEFGVHSSYHFYPWLSLKFGGGWRLVLPNEASYLGGYYIKLGLGFSTTKFFKAYREWKARGS